eukprot:gnl/Chilomastix_cuspidata/4269.p2 GENE.gnl/Chilomastix_cuspidata/4269~~gnl/Chilomastix_cuspidata/4269.p2  ORF type:complete len:190 (-),score=67.87 gnl/Chilomastix_cuspidata/4269:10-579(-)
MKDELGSFLDEAARLGFETQPSTEFSVQDLSILADKFHTYVASLQRYTTGHEFTTKVLDGKIPLDDETALATARDVRLLTRALQSIVAQHYRVVVYLQRAMKPRKLFVQKNKQKDFALAVREVADAADTADEIHRTLDWIERGFRDARSRDFEQLFQETLMTLSRVEADLTRSWRLGLLLARRADPLAE